MSFLGKTKLLLLTVWQVHIDTINRVRHFSGVPEPDAYGVYSN